MTIDENGNKEWKLPNGEPHREDGAAIEWSNGDKWWCINNLRHREDGPACEYSDGRKYWYLSGIEYTKKEYKYEMRSRKLKLLL